MENIYKAKSQHVVHVWEALVEFQRELYLQKLSRNVETEKDLMEAMGITEDSAEFDRLLESVDIDGNLSKDEDVVAPIFHPHKPYLPIHIPEVPKQALNFNCVQRALETQRSKAKRNKEVKLRYNRHKYVEHEPNSETDDLVPFQEMLIILRFYEPFKYKPARRLGHPRFNQEYYVLSSQYLTELKDTFPCICDEGPFYEMSNTKMQPDVRQEPPVPNSGFFFIHDTFYNDLREKENQDYSSCIRKWAERQQIIGELKSARMEETRFGDLKFRVGYPQLYQHYGNCEHLFVISDCRLLALSDILARSRYPFLNSYGFPREVTCNICSHFEATFIVRNSNQHIFDPAYICESCLDSYHYKDGQKIGEFELYRYLSARHPRKPTEDTQ